MSEWDQTDAPVRRGPIARWIERRFGWAVYRGLAALGALGCAAVFAADVAMWALLEGYSPIRNTISDAAAGRHAWVMDTGLLAFAGGVMALTLGLVLRGRGDGQSLLVRAALALLCVDLGFIALINDYGDEDPGGLVLHDGFVVVWGVLVAVILWFLPSVPPAGRDGLSKAARPLAILWGLAAAFLEAVPETVLGAYERGLGLVVVGATLVASWKLYQRPDGFRRPVQRQSRLASP